MDNTEQVLEALEEFGRNPTGEISPLLGRYLERIATTGETLFPWASVKPLFAKKMDEAMDNFYKEVPTDHLAPVPNVENVSFEAMKQRLLTTVESFTGTPFTIQRLCELITKPTKHYKRTDKFLRGIEKNMLVVSSVDPHGNKIVCEGKPMVNGMDSNGFEAAQKTPLKRAFHLPPAPANSPVTNGWFNNGAAAGPAYTTSWPQGSGDAPANTATTASQITSPVTSSTTTSPLAREPIRPEAVMRPGEGSLADSSEAAATSEGDSRPAGEGKESKEKGASEVDAEAESTVSQTAAADSGTGNVTEIPGVGGSAVKEKDEEGLEMESTEESKADSGDSNDADTDADSSRRDSGDSQGSQGFEASDDVSDSDLPQSSTGPEEMPAEQPQRDPSPSEAEQKEEPQSKQKDLSAVSQEVVEESSKRSQPDDSGDSESELPGESPCKKIKMDTDSPMEADEGLSTPKEDAPIDSDQKVKSPDTSDVDSESEKPTQDSTEQVDDKSADSSTGSSSAEKTPERTGEAECGIDSSTSETHSSSSCSSSSSTSLTTSSSGSCGVSSTISDSADGAGESPAQAAVDSAEAQSQNSSSDSVEKDRLPAKPDGAHEPMDVDS